MRIRNGEIIVFVIVFVLFCCIAIFFSFHNQEDEYNYLGTIVDMEGGSSSQLIILELDTVGKTPYTLQKKCSNKIRIGQEVYKKVGSDYLWVEYEPDKFC